MSTSDWKRGEQRCGIEGCRSRRYKVADDGLTYCQNGHQQLHKGFVIGDDAYATPAAKKSRRHEEEEEAPPKYLSGTSSARLYLRCFQLVLRKQVWWLIHDQGYDPALESVVRNLWALRMQMLDERLLQDADPQQLFTSQTSSIRGRASSFDSPPPSDVESRPVTPKHRLAVSKRLPQLIESISLIYLGFLLLRLPASLGDLRTWIHTPGFTYLRAIDAIPLEMKRPIHPARLHTFHARTGCPGPHALYTATLHICATFADHGMTIPPLNSPLLLYAHVQTLGLPIDIFGAARTLAQVLDVKFTYPTGSTKMRLPHHPELQIVSFVAIAANILYPFDGRSRQPRAIDEPAALQLSWSDWTAAWTNRQASIRQLPARQNESMLETTEPDVLSMSPVAMDAYLAWYQSMWTATSATQTPFDKAMQDMFPVSNISAAPGPPAAVVAAAPALEPEPEPVSGSESGSGSESQSEHASQSEPEPEPTLSAQIQSRLTQLAPVAYRAAKAPIARPGSAYCEYRSATQLPEHARVFFNALAQTAGLDLELLLQGMAFWERQLRLTVPERDASQGKGKNRNDNEGEDETGDEIMVD